jgi:hypothetical protein
MLGDSRLLANGIAGVDLTDPFHSNNITVVFVDMSANVIASFALGTPSASFNFGSDATRTTRYHGVTYGGVSHVLGSDGTDLVLAPTGGVGAFAPIGMIARKDKVHTLMKTGTQICSVDTLGQQFNYDVSSVPFITGFSVRTPSYSQIGRLKQVQAWG